MKLGIDIRVGQTWRCKGYKGLGKECGYYDSEWKIAWMDSDGTFAICTKESECNHCTLGMGGQDGLANYGKILELIDGGDGMCIKCKTSRQRMIDRDRYCFDGRCWSCV